MLPMSLLLSEHPFPRLSILARINRQVAPQLEFWMNYRNPILGITLSRVIQNRRQLSWIYSADIALISLTKCHPLYNSISQHEFCQCYLCGKFYETKNICFVFIFDHQFMKYVWLDILFNNCVCILMSPDSSMAPGNAMCNPQIKLPQFIHFRGPVQLVT